MRERSPANAQSAPSNVAPWAWAASCVLGLGAGVAAYATGLRSPLVALVVAWYVTESLLILARLIRPPRREPLLGAVLPRVVGTVISLPIAYLLVPGPPTAVPLAYLILIALEGAYRALGRSVGWLGSSLQPDGVRRPVEGQPAGRSLLAGRIAATVVTALLLTLTLYAQGVRAVLLDARLYADAFEPLGLYGQLLDAASALLVGAARDQGGQARRAVDLLTGQELEAATRIVLPEVWTEALFEQALSSTFTWLEEGTPGGVPPLSVPVADVQAHLKAAVSYLFDQVAPRLPACTERASRAAFCRPPGTSVAAFVAIYKPEALAIVDEALALLPGEIDLATAVTMSPRTFRTLLDLLGQAGEALVVVDRAISWLGWAALAAVGILIVLSARSVREALRWCGIALLAAGIATWLLSWSLAASGADSLILRPVVEALPGSEGEAFLRPLLAVALRAVHARPWPVELVGAVLGGLGLFASLVLRARQGHRWRPIVAFRALAGTAAALALLWALYLRAGERAYERANALYREGEVRGALARYEALLGSYPVGVRRPFLARARRDARTCALAAAAADALRDEAYDRAAVTYEALLLSSPPVALRDAAAQGMLAALEEAAAALRAGGAYERALDRLRLAKEALGSRAVYEPMAALYLEWGDALLAEGDYGAAAATYARIRYDVPSARHWQAADERAAEAYCVWQAALRGAGDGPGAAWVCDLFAEALPRLVGECAGCSR